MIEAAQLKPFLLHEDIDVRDSVAAYFADSWAQDEDLMPLILDAVDRYGAAETTHMLVVASRFSLTQEYLLRFLASLTAARDIDTVLRLNAILAGAPVTLLRAHESAFLDATNVLSETIERLERRRELAGKPGDELWQMLRDFSDSSRDAQHAGDIDHSFADDLIKALGRSDIPNTGEVCSLLSSPELDEEWLEIFLVDLAGIRRMRGAIPQLVAKLHIDTDYLRERACEALARIGDPEAAQQVRAEFGGSPWGFKLYAAGVLGDLKHEESEETMLALLESEEDASIRTQLCFGLCKLFSLAGFDAVRREIASGYDRIMVCLEDELLVVGEVLGVELPEADEWRTQRADRRLRQAERRAELEEAGRRYSELKARGIDPFADIDEEPDLDLKEPLQPVRREREKVGRNDPCPCGSGRKYKKCCGKQHSELAAMPPNNAPQIAATSQDSTRKPRMTVRALEQIEYRRGLVEAGMKPDDLPVKIWPNAAMPSEIRQAIEKEDLLSLGGVYGDERVGDPMEYDHLRLIGTDGVVEIVVFNRGITLFTTDNEKVRRIHRVLCKLNDAIDGKASRAD